MDVDERAKEIVESLQRRHDPVEPIKPSEPGGILFVLVTSNPIRHTVFIAIAIYFLVKLYIR